MRTSLYSPRRKAKMSDSGLDIDVDYSAGTTSRPRRTHCTAVNLCYLIAGLLIHELITCLPISTQIFDENQGISSPKPILSADEIPGGPYYARGRHLLVDLQGASGQVLNDRQGLEDTVVSIIKNAGMHMLSVSSHQLEPQGVSVVAAISESHLTIHTWPEHGAALVDLFTCGESADMLGILPKMVKAFGGEMSKTKWSLVRRGYDGMRDIDNMVLARQHVKKTLEVDVTNDLQNIQIWAVDATKEFETDQQVLKESNERQGERYEKNVMLFLNNVLQSGTKDDHVYHETIVHPALITHERGPERVAILGGGEGATLREVLKYKSVKQVDMIEIDEQVVDISRKFLPSMANCSWSSSKGYKSCFDDKRTNLVVDDAQSYFNSRFQGNPCNSKEEAKYDVIIMDLLDPEALPKITDQQMYSAQFFKEISCALRADGVLVTQFGEAGGVLQGTVADHKAEIVQNLAGAFYPGGTFVYRQFLETYNAEWSFAVGCKTEKCRDRWSQSPDTVDAIVNNRLDQRALEENNLNFGKLKFFNGLTMQRFRSYPSLV
eukprot:m.4603 g.4603  ORF g.4603 m.4603 type:complete len:549 (+) comp3028_c0_seq2:293-1939(+)